MRVGLFALCGSHRSCLLSRFWTTVRLQRDASISELMVKLDLGADRDPERPLELPMAGQRRSAVTPPPIPADEWPRAGLAEQGREALTMQAVATAAGVGKGTVFHRFGDRDGLTGALLDDYMRGFQDAFLHGPPPLGPGAPPTDRLEAFVVELVGFRPTTSSWRCAEDPAGLALHVTACCSSTSGRSCTRSTPRSTRESSPGSSSARSPHRYWPACAACWASIRRRSRPAPERSCKGSRAPIGRDQAPRRLVAGR